jgi:threonine/homoserine/homoserine lactone efflux protein
LKRGMSSAIKAILGVETANLTFIVFFGSRTNSSVSCVSAVVHSDALGRRPLPDLFRPTFAPGRIPSAGLDVRPATVLPSQHAYWQGLTTGLGNPKALIYWTALFPQLLDSRNPPSTSTPFWA